MSSLYTDLVIVDERSTGLQRRAERARLAGLARCCRPSAWARTARRAAAALSRPRGGQVAATSCCATA
ncbi:hypothetical protein [Petropleomorpha daqingensis]|uniref:Uncharacterized protein n=1 Tax=Petropleomorpha daqingensis TaxID=2026353 RepID=A0A853CAM0_9ACTN|nr:hypothetical protein [Petropleomorpha daqingensis]NYJ05005.1 hypothetical protein [Petropleomorpha daqingensis]